jgi:hypothetical protein
MHTVESTKVIVSEIVSFLTVHIQSSQDATSHAKVYCTVGLNLIVVTLICRTSTLCSSFEFNL